MELQSLLFCLEAEDMLVLEQEKGDRKAVDKTCCCAFPQPQGGGEACEYLTSGWGG